jgi:hypothetical protein
VRFTFPGKNHSKSNSFSFSPATLAATSLEGFSLIMAKKDLVDIAGEIRGETEAAFRFFDGDITVWLPKSQCTWEPDEKVMTMPEWLAKEKELI